MLRLETQDHEGDRSELYWLEGERCLTEFAWSSPTSEPSPLMLALTAVYNFLLIGNGVGSLASGLFCVERL
jgi:hypothetical protein